MKYHSFPVILVITCVYFSCATYHFEAIPSEKITIITNRGSTYPYYKDENIELIIDPEFNDSDVMLKISIKNISDESIFVKDSDFSVYCSKDNKKWEKLETYNSKEFYTKEKNEYITGAVLLALSAAASSASSSRRTSYTTGNIYRNGRYYGSFYSRTDYNDPTATQINNYNNSLMISNYSRKSEEWLNFLKNNLFYEKTLLAGEDYFGIVFAESELWDYYRVVFSNDQLSEISIEYITVED